ncbi:MAG: 4-hydroxy-tetrahydrodipicolinate reductase [Candidatus Schekmanbacteria bacterium RIFCSPHIGHO2_02_FULL_38_11]|uniref:4-hydroxy-tetrahydrodipicolinate reductase n=1 Tax=Candidatus Schekmanbacteria bacterium RIFCSPLOWO2_12_FULL_38_15 TaxID=1817883 RepID=A0A1F7SJN5_9BACT|nr:MAG: 4-hydroxy-tetrahydrodipicolinate reductase [Candidatus Schekmanbacteria bacterium GWA2_38_9]OGL50822.1 MAG: 4-hydroxy-tetrahydrodipicolinate reductase [Candidatus Schekmanbacteria bacterium RIFCSPLOWO2_02_FULL_38_14]OGL53417.1 MAG: 4-hydroxy-tetrahydrodipicolinate reductase [Candidatus Schekmanbacteria bacterium RIFCSPLOWO2_12_FULL_38_15]OGL55769.1 MAG: 4-hydroxy-tetrahydrodipicolinate reductase [Candidatus Schekmanbacteria bacterium RIFCSPHIGHO2_02_FULL_38_11]
MVKTIITGACGRMGKMIRDAILESDGIKVVGGTEVKGHKCIGKEIEPEKGYKIKISDDISEIIDSCDVVIDFTFPQATISNLEVCRKNKKAIVIGTTGLIAEQKKKISEAAKSIPIVLSPNMSVGVNLVFDLVKKISKVLGDEYDIEIYEAHHRFKKDAPSGTALKIAEIIAESLGRDLDRDGVYGRKGIVGERKKEEIGIHSIRAGDIVGDHTVLFSAHGERIEITHRAHSRETFARGAVRAAKFVASKKNGLFDMIGVLGIK